MFWINLRQFMSGPAFPLLGILLVIQVRGDGYFPFPKDLPENLFLSIVFLHTLLISGFIFRAIFLLIREKDSPLFENQIPYWFAAGAVPVCALLGIGGLHILQAGRFSEFGYNMDFPVLFVFLLLSLLPLVFYWLFIRRRYAHSMHLFLVCVLLSSLIAKMIPLELFPLHHARSDMLLIIEEAALKVFHGAGDIYRPYRGEDFYYLNIRPPGLLAAYIPAAAWDFDLRIVNLVLEASTFLFLFSLVPAERSAVPSRTPWELILPLTCLILFPYWHYRHELYEPPLWFLLILTLLALEARRVLGFTLGLGALMVTHQWAWVFFPLLAAAFFKQQGWGPTLACLAAVSVFSVSVYACVIDNFSQFVSIFINSVTATRYNPPSMNFAPQFFIFHLEYLLRPIGALLQIPLLVLAFRCGHRIDALCGILAGSLTVVLLFNPTFCWAYQYLLVAFLLISGFLFRFKTST